MSTVAGLAGRLRRDRRGVASIEAALAIGLVLVPLCLGMIDYGTEIAATSRLDRALQAASFYVWANAGSFTASGIQNAANAGYGSAAPTLAVSSSTACSCVSASYIPTAAVACSGGTCPTGQQVASYLTISASIALPLPVPFPALTSPAPLAVQGTIRTR